MRNGIIMFPEKIVLWILKKTRSNLWRINIQRITKMVKSFLSKPIPFGTKMLLEHYTRLFPKKNRKPASRYCKK